MKKTFVILLFTLGLSPVFAQSGKLQGMEQELVLVHNTAAKSLYYEHNTSYDNGIEFYSELTNLSFRQFDIMLNKILIEDQGMTYPFGELRKSGINGTNIVWSCDSLLRVFSWMLPGGTQQFYGNTIQYKNTSSITCTLPFQIEYDEYPSAKDGSYDYLHIYLLRNSDKNIYILSGSAQRSTRIASYRLMAFSIVDKLVVENVFEDINGKQSNEINVSYDIADSYANLPMGEFPRPIIDEKKKLLKVPRIIDNRFTGEYIQYVFDGRKFNSPLR